MSREDFVKTMLLGVVLVLALIISGFWLNRQALLDECERNLPRTQECKIIAVPKKVTDEQ